MASRRPWPGSRGWVPSPSRRPCRSYFLTRSLPGAGLSVSVPGFLLLAAWAGVFGTAVRTWRAQRVVWPNTRYDAPLALFLAAALLSLAVSQYPLLSVREARAVLLEPILFFWLLPVLRRVHGATAALVGFLSIAAITAGWQSCRSGSAWAARPPKGSCERKRGTRRRTTWR